MGLRGNELLQRLARRGVIDPPLPERASRLSVPGYCGSLPIAALCARRRNGWSIEGLALVTGRSRSAVQRLLGKYGVKGKHGGDRKKSGWERRQILDAR